MSFNIGEIVVMSRAVCHHILMGTEFIRIFLGTVQPIYTYNVPHKWLLKKIRKKNTLLNSFFAIYFGLFLNSFFITLCDSYKPSIHMLKGLRMSKS